MRHLFTVLLGLLLAGPTLAQPTDLIISEYVEGSSFNKAIELYNGTAFDIDLTEYAIQIFSNGSSTVSSTVDLSGIVSSSTVFVVAETRADSTILAVADQTSGSLSFNGDDAVVLYRDTVVVDVIGQVGFDPGSEWGSGDTSTQDNTLRRIGNDCLPDEDPSDAFDPDVNYEGFPLNDFSDLGQALLNCGQPAALAPELEPTTFPVVIPAEGGSFTYTATVNNVSTQSQTFDAWITAFLPDGNTIGPIEGPVTLTLASGETVMRTLRARVPGAAPVGDYTVELNVGSFPDEIIVSDGFMLTKLASTDRAAQPNEAAIVAVGPGLAEAAQSSTAGAGTPGAATVYPNPSRGQTTVEFTLPAPAEVRLAVFDALGREVAVLVEGALDGGTHTATLESTALPAGVYVYRLTAGGRTNTGRLTLVR